MVNAISAAPLASENTKLNTCDEPVPDPCETDTATGVTALAAVTLNIALLLWTSAALVPVAVIVDVPAGVPDVVVKVNVLDPDPDTELGLKLPLTPAGNPDTARLTVSLNPFTADSVTLKLVFSPAVTVCDSGVMLIPKSAGGDVPVPPVMVSEAVVLWFKDPAVPVTVMAIPPAAAPLLVITVNVVEPDPVTVVGLKLPATPEGSPVVAKFTGPLNPLLPVTVTVYVALPPAATLPGPVDMLIEKSGCAVTVSPQVTLTPE
jgi:hypothetical protein